MNIYEAKSEPQNTVDENPTVEYGKYVFSGSGVGIQFPDHPYTFHGFATVEAIQAINVVKKVLTLQPLKAAEMAILPFTMKAEYMHPCPRELRKIFTGRIGHLIAQVIEYDSAYRFRLQDLLSETSQEALSQKPIREVLRLVRINKQRDYADAHQKVKKAAYLLVLGLLWPPFNIAFRKSIKRADFPHLQLSEEDAYWLNLRQDYHKQKGARSL